MEMYYDESMKESLFLQRDKLEIGWWKWNC